MNAFQKFNGTTRALLTNVLPVALSALYVGHKIDSNLSIMHDSASKIFNELKLGNTIHAGIDNKLSQISDQISKLTSVVDKLSGNIDLGFSSVIQSLNMIYNTEVKGFSSIVEILSTPNKTNAKEHFLDGIEFYKMACRYPDKIRFQSESLKHLLESVSLYANNCYGHFFIGNMYFAFDASFDFDQALLHYLAAADYGEACYSFRLASISLSNAAVISDLLSNNSDASIGLSRKAASIYPLCYASRYVHARLLIKHGLIDESVETVRQLNIDTNGQANKIILGDSYYEQIWSFLR